MDNTQLIARPFAAPSYRNPAEAAVAVASHCHYDTRREQMPARLHAIMDGLDPAVRQERLVAMKELCEASASFVGSRLVTAYRSDYSSQYRKDRLAELYAAAFDTSLANAAAAVDKARKTNIVDLAQVLSSDAATIAAYVSALHCAAPIAMGGLALTAGRASAAWHGAGWLAGAKAAAWGAATGGAGFLCLAGLTAITFLTNDFLEKNERPRRNAYAAEYGKDLILLELITGNMHVPRYVGTGFYSHSEARPPRVREGGAR